MAVLQGGLDILALYWPFVVLALILGVVSGWLNTPARSADRLPES